VDDKIGSPEDKSVRLWNGSSRRYPPMSGSWCPGIKGWRLKSLALEWAN